MSKLYFYDKESESCYTIEYIQDQMMFDGIIEKEVYKAKMMKGFDMFYCKYFGEIGEVGEGCGKECSKYSPRNGKSGRCRYSSNCYEHGEKVTVKLK